jgi:pyruvate/2-oxoglutarate dehydrogenase complex dihydrolipoamide dehydrogenase (E3) component
LTDHDVVVIGAGPTGENVAGRAVRGGLTAEIVESELVAGATPAGRGVGEMIHAATVAVAGQVTLHLLRHAVPSYPTMSEVWLRLLEAYGL